MDSAHVALRKDAIALIKAAGNQRPRYYDESYRRVVRARKLQVIASQPSGTYENTPYCSVACKDAIDPEDSFDLIMGYRRQESASGCASSFLSC